MKLNINLEEDAQFKKEVKKLIQGQVASILRDEIKTVVMEVMAKENKKFTADRLTELMRKEISVRVDNFAAKGAYPNSDYNLHVIVKEQVREWLEKERPLMEKVVAEKLTGFQGETFEEMVYRQVKVAIPRVLSGLIK
jgi:hypothetical protein